MLKKHVWDVLCNVLCSPWGGSPWEGRMESLHTGEERFGWVLLSLLFPLEEKKKV